MQISLDECTHITNPAISPVVHFTVPPRLLLHTAYHDIDFDEASRAWMANKVRKGLMINYRCSAIQKNGLQCPMAEHLNGVCKRHRIRTTQSPLRKENHLEEAKVHAFVVQETNLLVPVA